MGDGLPEFRQKEARVGVRQGVSVVVCVEVAFREDVALGLAGLRRHVQDKVDQVVAEDSLEGGVAKESAFHVLRVAIRAGIENGAVTGEQFNRDNFDLIFGLRNGL